MDVPTPDIDVPWERGSTCPSLVSLPGVFGVQCARTSLLPHPWWWKQLLLKGVSGKTAFGNKKWNIVWFGVNTGPGERPVQRPEHGAVPVPEKQGEEAQPRSQSLPSQSARVWQARPSSLGQTGMLGVVISPL